MSRRDPVVISGPILEPVFPQDMRAQCKVDVQDAAQDALLEQYISVARRYVEYRTGRTIQQKTLLWMPNGWPDYDEGVIRLPWATPLIAIESIKYTDVSGTETTWASSNYDVDTDSNPGPGGFAPKYGIPLPSFVPSRINPIKIRYTAGIADTSPPSDAPAEIKQPIMLLAAAMFENREAEVLPNRSAVDFVVPELAGFEAQLCLLMVSYGN